MAEKRAAKIAVTAITNVFCRLSTVKEWEDSTEEVSGEEKVLSGEEYTHDDKHSMLLDKPSGIHETTNKLHFVNWMKVREALLPPSCSYVFLNYGGERLADLTSLITSCLQERI